MNAKLAFEERSNVHIKEQLYLRAIVNIVFQSFPGLFCLVVAICWGVK